MWDKILDLRMWVRSHMRLMDDLHECKAQRKADEKLCAATVLNLETANDMLVSDMEVLSDEMLALNEINKQLRENCDSQLVYPYPTPIAAVKDYQWLWTAIHNYQIPFGFLPHDPEFSMPPKEDTLKFLAWDLTDEPPYIKDDRDCDKYARRLWSRYAWLTPWNNLGYVLDLSGGHAYNCFVTEDARVWIIEPQSDRVWEFNAAKANGIYAAENGYLLI